MKKLLLAIGMLALASVASAQSVYLDKMTLARDASFQKRIEFALVKVALIVIDEDPATTNHDQRIAVARRILQDPTAYAYRLAPGVVSQSQVTDASTTDAQLQTAVNSTLQAYAKGDVLK